MEFKSHILAGTVLGLFMPSAFAQLTATLYTASDGQPARYRDPNSAGGEFTSVLTDNSSVSGYVLSHYDPVATTTVNGHTGFQTFCVEMTQNLTPGTAYNAVIGSTIMPGNTPLSQGVAWLYMEFASGGLASYASTHFGSSSGAENYNYSTSSIAREVCSDELQDAIWYLQGEMDSGNSSLWNNKNLKYSFNLSNPTADPFVKLVTQVFGNLQTAEEATSASGANNFGVMVLNLSSTSNGTTVYDQDQLVYCPVPEPTTVGAGLCALLPLGLSVARGFRRQKKI